MNKFFLFDIDGTITPTREKIDTEFSEFFTDFCLSNRVCFVTGSDRDKTISQVGESLFDLVEYSFNCSGNEVWSKNKLLHHYEWHVDRDLVDYLTHLLEKSKYPTKTGNHFEYRNGMMNFSVLGRNSSAEERKSYIQWDKNTNERLHILNKVKSNFSNVEVFIGGEIGIDIVKKGRGKSQVVSFLREKEKYIIYYFGDQIFENGNDYDVAKLCDHYYQVKNWQDTYEILSYFKEAGVCK